MKTNIKYLLILCIVLLTSSCKGIYEDATEMAADYKSEIKSISVAELQAKTDKGESYLLIDVRQPDEYLTENIPGSVSIPRGLLEFNIGSEEFQCNVFVFRVFRRNGKTVE